MELNREQIIKALEYCTNPDRGAYCPQSDCPYGDVGSCEQLLMCHALALIKELTEENERLRIDNGKYEAENHAQFDKWLKLEEATKRHHSELFEEAKIAVKEDTVRKMQERLKSIFVGKEYTLYTGASIHETIDQIVKEMIGEGND